MRFLQMYTPFFIHFPIPKNHPSFFLLQGVSILNGKRMNTNCLLNFCTTGFTIDVESLSKLHEHCKWRGSK